MKRLIVILLSIMLTLGCFGCAKKASEDKKVLAKFSNRSITLGEFKSRIARLPAYYRDVIERNKKKFLDETIVEMMFYEEALRKGLDRDREVTEVLSEAKKKIMIAKLIKTEVEDKIKIDDGEARQFYEVHKDEFKAPELWRASHILVSSEAEAKDALNQIRNGADFEELARQKSMDATAARGGDVGYFRKGQLIPDFENACLNLEPGQVGTIVQTQFGYHVIKLTDKKETAIEPYERVKERIIDALKKKKRSELFDKLVLDLKNKYNVEVQDDVFKTLDAIEGEKKAVVK